MAMVMAMATAMAMVKEVLDSMGCAECTGAALDPRGT
jgi:hypothetical protein